MKNSKLSQIRNVARTSLLNEKLTGDRLWVAVAAISVVCAAIFSVYMTMSVGRLELVYLDKDKLDGPTLLDKVRGNRSEVKSDRYVRGFARRVINAYFIPPFEADEQAMSDLKWLHAHASPAGKARQDVYIRQFDEWVGIRRNNSYTMFYPVNDPASVRIRQRGTSGDFQVEIPGTYEVRAGNSERSFDALLVMRVTAAKVTGIASSYGVVNVSGLEIQNGYVEYMEDMARPDAKTKVGLFNTVQ